MTYAEFTAKVRTLLTDVKTTDDHFIQATAAWVRSQYARIYSSQTSYNSFKGTYDKKRRKLIGYVPTQSLADVKNSTKTYLTDASAETLFPETISRYVKYHILEEIDRDPTLADRIKQTYTVDRIRLVGYTTSLTKTQLEDEVRKYLPVDKDRQNVQTYLNELIIQAQKDIEALGIWMDGEIDKAYDDLTGFKYWVDQQPRQCLIEIQELIPAFLDGNVNVYDYRNTSRIGAASTGALPTNAEVQRVRLRYPSIEEGVGCGLGVVPWSQREGLLNDACACEPRFTVDPQGDNFIVFPRLSSGFPEWANAVDYVVDNKVEHEGIYYIVTVAGTSSGTSPLDDSGVTWVEYSIAPPVELLIYWKGNKLEYADTDIVPFPELAAKAVAHFIKSQIFEEIEEQINKTRFEYEQYRLVRRQLHSLMVRRGTVTDPLPAPSCQSSEAFAPIVVSLTEGPIYVNVGENIQLDVSVVSNPQPTFTWTKS